ncbi:MAG: hypothetical protein JL56_00690, partial [Desulfotomaculum sp. BICA1-6]
EGASVTVTGAGNYSATTGSDGNTQTYSDIATGDYNATASFSGYNDGNGSVTVTGCDDYEIRIGLCQPNQCDRSLQVYVYDADLGEDYPIAGATITISGPESLAGTTDTSGYTQVYNGDLTAGTYTATASKRGYNSGSDSETAIGCNDYLIKIGLHQPITPPCDRSLQVYVYDADQGEDHPISGAAVALSGPEGFTASDDTDSEGCTEIYNGDLVAGTYNATVGKSGYNSGSSSVEATDCDDYLIKIGLRKSTPPPPPCERSVQVYVYDADKGEDYPISGAAVTLSGPEGFTISDDTDSEGCTEVYNGDLVAGTYNATAGKSGYNSGSGTVEATGCDDYLIKIGLRQSTPPPPPCERSVQVYVYDADKGEEHPLSGASVSITGPRDFTSSDDTNGDGYTNVYNGDLVAGTYKATASKSGYYSGSSTVAVTDCDDYLIKIGLSKPSQPSKPSSSSKKCDRSVTVFVFDANTGNPVEGAAVSLIGPGSFAADDNTENDGYTKVYNGKLSAGTYSASAVKEGYSSGSDSVEAFGCSKYEIRIGLAKEVEPDAPEIVVPPVEPFVPAPPPDLPFTGGNAMAYLTLGITLAGLGTLLRRRL